MVPVFQEKNSSPFWVLVDDSFRCFYRCIRNKTADASTLCGGRLVDERPLVLRQIDKGLPT
jgi:hypothetical protein